MTAEQESKLQTELFNRYGQTGYESADKQIHIYATNYNRINSQNDILVRLKYNEEDIQKLEKTLELLKLYRIALVERYNYLETVPTKTKYLLKREQRYNDNVFYYIIKYELNLDTNEEVYIESSKFTGKERKQAFTVFGKLQTEHPEAIFEKQIEKRS